MNDEKYIFYMKSYFKSITIIYKIDYLLPIILNRK